MEQSSLLAVGRFPEDAARVIEEAATSAGFTPRFALQCDEAGAGDELGAVVLPMNTAGAVQSCLQLRGQTRFAAVPIFGVTRQREDLSFIELFALGGDDLVGSGTTDALARRLRGLVSARPSSGSLGTAGRAGSAIVASPDTRWRSVMGRALFAGGYAVRFVTSAAELVAESLAEGVQVVVVADDLPPDGAVAAAKTARERGCEAAWVVVSPPKKMAAVHEAIAGLSRIAVVDGYAPPENVLFRANELASRPGPDLRSSPRLLYGTAVAFRVAGRDEDDVGFSYNVSKGGVYVRTLAPVEPNQEVWLDMWAPRSQRRVRLAGKVAWRRVFGASEKATVPPGFGVKITDGLAGDLQRWEQGCDEFAKTVLGEPVA